MTISNSSTSKIAIKLHERFLSLPKKLSQVENAHVTLSSPQTLLDISN